MTNEQNSRRWFLQTVAAAVPAATVASLAGAVATPAKAAPAYSPQYFTQKEWAFINAACDRLIPSEPPGAGAILAGVPEFIDRQMGTNYGHGGLWYLQGPFNPSAPATSGYQAPYPPRDAYRVAIAAINDFTQSKHQKDFADLDSKTQVEVLEAMEKDQVPIKSLPSRVFFDLLLDNTKEGYFSDPQYGGNRDMVGWKMIGFPGARADFADWVVQPGKKYPFGPISISGKES
jgi:gluconate 2-dehydrogenase gamma chain